MDDVFEKIEEVHKQLRRNDKFHLLPIKLDDIKDAIVAKSPVDEIHFIEVPTGKLIADTRIQGKIEIYERAPAVYALPNTVADIYYLDGLNEAERRFVVCKEMAHLLIHDGRVRNADELIDLINALVLPVPLRDFIAKMANQPQFASEMFANMFGLELLCPFQFREQFFVELQNGEKTYEDISSIFAVPTECVKMLFTAEFHEVQRSIRKRLKS